MARAQEPQGAALVPTQSIAAGELRWAGADALGRWSLVAGARHSPWEIPEREADLIPSPLVTAAAARHALAGERAAGRLAFEWQRDTGRRRIEATFLATRASTSLRDDPSPAGIASIDPRLQDRAQRTRLALSVGLAESTGWLGLPGERTVALRVADDRFDNRTLSGDGASGAETVLRRDAIAESRARIEMGQALRLGPVRAAAELRIERFALAGAAAGTLVAPAFSISAPLAGGSELFARAARGGDDFKRPLSAIDPWTGLGTRRADPAARGEFLESGMRWRGRQMEARFSAWRSNADSRLAYSEGGALETLQPDRRGGVALGLRYQPVAWLDIAADASLDMAPRDARTAQGFLGASRAFGSAGATLRMSRDWDARLSVSYLGPRPAAEEGTTLGATTLVNAQVVHWLGTTTRLSFDIFNLLNQRLQAVDSLAASRAGLLDGTGESFLSSPGEPRGFLLKLRTRF